MGVWCASVGLTECRGVGGEGRGWRGRGGGWVVNGVTHTPYYMCGGENRGREVGGRWKKTLTCWQ